MNMWKIIICVCIIFCLGLRDQTSFSSTSLGDYLLEFTVYTESYIRKFHIILKKKKRKKNKKRISILKDFNIKGFHYINIRGIFLMLLFCLFIFTRPQLIFHYNMYIFGKRFCFVCWFEN